MELKRRKGSCIYNPDLDQLDFEGKLFTGVFLRLADHDRFARMKFAIEQAAICLLNGDRIGLTKRCANLIINSAEDDLGMKWKKGSENIES